MVTANKAALDDPSWANVKQMVDANMNAAGMAPLGLTVYHGSPHKFSKFDMSKIGTGEGAQAYGHGLYTAEAKDVDQSYADSLGAARQDKINNAINRAHKMMDPRYRDVKREQIPELTMENDVKIKIICGKVGNTQGPVRDIVIDPEYLDVSVPAKSIFVHPTKRGHTVFAYVTEGKGYFCEEKHPFTYEVEEENYFDIKRDPFVGNGTLALFDNGDEVMFSTEDEPVRFLLISGKPISEPVAWYGPIVMNTQEELKLAFEEYNKGTFIKHKQ